MKPRIFISAVTKELRSARQIVANTLIALGYEPLWQDIFDTSGEDIRAMLRKKIDSCSAVLQIAGEAYGAEPRVPDETFGRVSYTQYEALYARSIGKKVYYLIASSNISRDATPESIDSPRDESENARVDAIQRRHLQRDYLASIQSTGHIYYPVQSNPETELAVRRLKDELDQLRRGFRNWMIGVSAGLLVIAFGILWLGGGLHGLLASVKEAQKKTVEQLAASGDKTTKELKEVVESAIKELTNPSVLAEQIRKEIHATAEARITTLTDEQGRGRKIAEIEKERDLATGRVDDLVKLIQEGLKEGPSPVFQRAADILQKEGTDEALAYLESRRKSTLDDARRHAEQAKTSLARAESEKELRNKSLQALVLEAELLESKLQWEPAIKLRQEIADLASDWFEARNSLGLLYLELARFQEAEDNFRATLKLAATELKESVARSHLARVLQATNRLTEAEQQYRQSLAVVERVYGPDNPGVAGNLSNLAQLLQATNHLEEAEVLFRRALAIYDKAPEDKIRQSDIASILNNLAQLLQDTSRLAEAELLMRRSLAIVERFNEAEQHSVAIHLNNLAWLLKITSRVTEAEPLMNRALAIDEKVYRHDHPVIARDLNNLAQLYQDTNRLAEAEPLMRRALAIDKQFYGDENPNVAIRLNNLALLLSETNRLPEAEELMRRALVIHETSYGSDHPEVAGSLINIAAILKATNRLEAAEPLIRRALAIDAQSYGNDHTNVGRDLNNLAFLLMNSSRLADAEALLRRALVIDEETYGKEHPDVASKTWSLASLLRRTKRLAQAIPLLRRSLSNYLLFAKQNDTEHRYWQPALSQYRSMLVEIDLPKERIEELIKEASTDTGPLPPITPEVERLLGPAKSTREVLDSLDQQYHETGKPAIWLLPLKEPISPHLIELLGPLTQKENFQSTTDI